MSLSTLLTVCGVGAAGPPDGKAFINVVEDSVTFNDAKMVRARLASKLQPGKTLQTSGSATNPYPRSAIALQLPLLGMFEPQTDTLFEDIQIGLRYVLGTRNLYTMALHGSGMTGMSAVLDNLIEPGDKILVCATGFWGDVASNVATRFGANLIRKEKALGESFELGEIGSYLSEYKPQFLYLVHGDSSTGVFHELDGIGDLCHLNNCLFIADVVATTGQQPVRMDEQKIDAVFANSQKGCGGVVGLAIVSFSPRAMEKIYQRKTPPKVFPTDIIAQAKVWNIIKCEIREASYLHSLSLPLLYMLREGLANIAEEGLEECWKRHQISSNYLCQQAQAIGLEPFVPKPKNRLQGTVLFKLPPGKNAYKIEEYILEKFQIAVSPGFGSTMGRVIRIGLFGNNANLENAGLIVDAVKQALNSCDTDA